MEAIFYFQRSMDWYGTCPRSDAGQGLGQLSTIPAKYSAGGFSTTAVQASKRVGMYSFSRAKFSLVSTGL